MTLSAFEERWKWITSRAGGETNIVQERHELEHIYNLMKSCDCKSYLEVGSAEGDSLYVLGSLPNEISYIDYGEQHTTRQRQEVLKLLGKDYTEYLGDSTDPETFLNKIHADSYDCILIDGGHDYETVLSDSRFYAPMAKKYVFWHDIQLPSVKAAVMRYLADKDMTNYSTFINTDNYGYGIWKIA